LLRQRWEGSETDARFHKHQKISRQSGMHEGFRMVEKNLNGKACEWQGMYLDDEEKQISEVGEIDSKVFIRL
jgi:hypothetical protein